MKQQTIALTLLVSPKQKLDFRKRSKIEFFQLVSLLRTKRKLDTPIEVYALNNGNYYISDGVHRAKAAELAKLDVIDAIVYSDSKPIGIAIPLKDVVIP